LHFYIQVYDTCPAIKHVTAAANPTLCLLLQQLHLLHKRHGLGSHALFVRLPSLRLSISLPLE
jgi:hypothetical protein